MINKLYVVTARAKQANLFCDLIDASPFNNENKVYSIIESHCKDLNKLQREWLRSPVKKLIKADDLEDIVLLVNEIKVIVFPI